MADFKETIYSTNGPETNLDGGAIAGIVIALLVLILLIAIVTLIRYKSLDWKQICPSDQSCRDLTADTGPLTFTSAGIPPKDASAEGAASPSKESMPGIEMRILNEIVNEVGIESNTIANLGINLGLDPAVIDSFVEINRESKSPNGTRKMLIEWKKDTGSSKQIHTLRKALIDSKLTEIAEKYFPEPDVEKEREANPNEGGGLLGVLRFVLNMANIT